MANDMKVIWKKYLEDRNKLESIVPPQYKEIFEETYETAKSKKTEAYERQKQKQSERYHLTKTEESQKKNAEYQRERLHRIKAEKQALSQQKIDKKPEEIKIESPKPDDEVIIVEPEIRLRRRR